MKRRLFSIWCVASLVLLVAAGAFWIRGLSTQDLPQLCYQWYPQLLVRHSRWISVRSAFGRFEFGIVRNDFDVLPPLGSDDDVSNDPGLAESFSRGNPRGLVWSYSATPIPKGWNYATVGDDWFGFGTYHYSRRAQGRHDEYWTISLPAWFVMALCCIAPALWYRRRLRVAYRQQSGLCLQCGYDLRASSDRCPECGTPIATAVERRRPPTWSRRTKALS